MDPRDDAAVRARLDRYLDLVEAWGLCPWAAPARRDGAIEVAIVRGGEAEVGAVVARWGAAGAGFRIGMIVLPDAALDPTALRHLRDRIAAAVPGVAIADFHPDGGDPSRDVDAARLVAILRRSPDPMLQVLPQAALAALAMPPVVASGAAQAAMLAGAGAGAAVDARARIAAVNLETVKARGIERLVEELAALRDP
jgi:hypothetical protein